VNENFRVGKLSIIDLSMESTNNHEGSLASRPKYLFLSHPRTGSVLLMRMLSHQPDLTQGEYFMASTMDMMLQDCETVGGTDFHQRQAWLPKLQVAFDRLQDFVEAFERGEDRFKSLYASRAEPLASGVRLDTPELFSDITVN
jgi:hypothetical protein